MTTNNRKRKRVVIFKQSLPEKEFLDTLVYLSGLKKQDYIYKRISGEGVRVLPSPRTLRHWKTKLLELDHQFSEMLSADGTISKEQIIIFNILKSLISELDGGTENDKENDKY